jgi:hypothetical protein
MLRAVLKLSIAVFLLTVSGLGVWQYRKYTAEQRQIADLRREKEQLQKQTEQLQQVVTRLTTEKRVAEILVTERGTDAAGVPVSNLLFVEYAKDGATLPPRQFTVRGDHVHVDGLVVEFASDFIQKDDPLRGHSILLFDKIYGSGQQPMNAERIDSPGTIPDLYRGASADVSQFEQELWTNFWRLADDEKFRAEKGVKVANGKSIYGPFRTDRLYTITLDATGKMSVIDEPLKGAVGEAMKRLSKTE